MGNNASSIGRGLGTPVTVKTTDKGQSDIQQIQYAVSGMQGMRNTMEDRHMMSNILPIHGQDALHDHSVFAVFDGHGGDLTSNFLQDNFLKFFSQRAEVMRYAALPLTGPKSRADVTGVQLLKQALMRTFIELDQALVVLQLERNQAIAAGKIQLPPPRNSDIDEDDDEIKVKPNSSTGERSGSTCVVVLITPSHFICANTGDSRAVLRRKGQVLPLSFDHKPSDVPERKRIVAAGGIVKAKRVDGDLAVSRAFGDFAYKQDKTRPPDKQRVIVVPDFVVYPRDKEHDEFIVLACDGVWDVASNKQCTDFIQTLLTEGEVDLGNVCEEALDTCLDRKSRDNMTLMIVGLPGLKAEVSGSAAVNNALWGHRSSRRTKQLTHAVADLTHRTCLAIGSPCVSMERSLCAA